MTVLSDFLAVARHRLACRRRAPVRRLVVALAASVFALKAEPAAAEDFQLVGKLSSDPATGVVAGDVCLNGLAATQAFLLHRGLNVRGVRDAATGERIHFDFDGHARETDAEAYRFVMPAKVKSYCVEYVGRYPVYQVERGERAELDSMSDVAFDGRSVRSTYAARFLPVPLDAKNNAINALTFKLTVECAGCRSLYVNGAAPQPGPRAEFTSNVPRPMLLYGGDFPVTTKGRAHFVGAPVSDAGAKAISSDLQALAEFHERYIGAPYRDTPSFMSFAAVGWDRKLDATSWQFVSWPTIGADGRLAFDSILDPTDPAHMRPGWIRLLAHEMAHYYFGTVYEPHGPLRWFLVESVAEFMAMRYIRDRQGPEEFQKRWDRRASEVKRIKAIVPLNRISDPEQIDVDYRYALGPLLLFALERDVGAEPLRRALGSLVQSPPTGEADWAMLAERLRKGGASPDRLKAFEQQCLTPRPAPACLEP